MSGKASSAQPKKREKRKVAEVLKTEQYDYSGDCRLFQYLLTKFCNENNCPLFPIVRDFLEKPDGQLIPLINCELEDTANTENRDINLKLYQSEIESYYDMDILLKRVVCRGQKMPDSVFSALAKCINSFPSLYCLKLDFCGLTSDHIEILGSILKSKRTLADLSLRGNPNKDQNFYVLLEETGIKTLSLKLCEIDEHGIQKISNVFENTNSNLVHLDLSSNMIFDEGCKFLARILRCDRILQSLNIADCKITDEGCEEIMNCFKKFALLPEEMYLRRKLRMEYFKALQKVETNSSDTNKSVNRKENVRRKSSEPCTENNTVNLIEVEDAMKKHPFIFDSYQENGDIFCKGNFSLNSLNLSYNGITKTGFDVILKSLMNQSSVYGSQKGITRLVLRGNPGDVCEENANAIEDFLTSRTVRRSLDSNRSKSSLKRKKSGSPSVASNLKENGSNKLGT